MMTWILFLGGLYVAIALSAFAWLRSDPYPYGGYWETLFLDTVFALFWPLTAIYIMYLIITDDSYDD